MRPGILLALAAFLADSACAITWNPTMTDPLPNTNRNVSTVSSNLARDPRFNGTGIVRTAKGRHGTGCLIGNRWVLTARHFVEGQADGTFVLEGASVPIVRFHTREDTDIAVAELGEPVDKYPVVELYDGADEIGKAVYLVGYGLRGEFTGDPSELAGGGRHAAMNIIDEVRDCGGRIGETLVICYDGAGEGALPLEGAVAPGDSGSPIFLEEKGELRLVGQTYGVIPGENGFFFGRVSRYLDWIKSVIAGPARSQKS